MEMIRSGHSRTTVVVAPCNRRTTAVCAVFNQNSLSFKVVWSLKAVSDCVSPYMFVATCSAIKTLCTRIFFGGVGVGWGSPSRQLSSAQITALNFLFSFSGFFLCGCFSLGKSFRAIEVRGRLHVMSAETKMKDIIKLCHQLRIMSSGDSTAVSDVFLDPAWS